MVVTQHVKNNNTMSESQNEQLQRAMKVGDQHEGEEEKTPAVEAVAAIHKENEEAQYGDGARKKTGARQVHRTRSVSKRNKSAARQEERDASDVVNVAYERDLLIYGEKMRSTKRTKWQTAMQEEIAALESNDVWLITKRARE